MKSKLTDDKIFEIFKEEFKHWHTYFDLSRFEIMFFQEDLSKIEACAKVGVDLEAMVARVAVDNHLSKEKYTAYEIRLAAFHECCELMLYKLQEYGCATIAPELVHQAAHEVINVLQHKIFDVYYAASTEEAVEKLESNK